MGSSFRLFEPSPDPKPTSSNTFPWKKSNVVIFMWDYSYIILGVLAQLRSGSFVFLAAARFSGKHDQKGNVANPKVGVID